MAQPRVNTIIKNCNVSFIVKVLRQRARHDRGRSCKGDGTGKGSLKNSRRAAGDGGAGAELRAFKIGRCATRVAESRLKRGVG